MNRSTTWGCRSKWVNLVSEWNFVGFTGTEKNSHRGFEKNNCKKEATQPETITAQYKIEEGDGSEPS